MAPEDGVREGPSVPFHPAQKTWPQLIDHAAQWRNWNTKYRHLSSNVAATFKFSEPWEKDGERLVRIYCLGAYGKTYTVCYLDVKLDSFSAARTMPIRVLNWNPLLTEDPECKKEAGFVGVLSHGEELRRERMRSNVSGVTGYQLATQDSSILLTAPPKLYMATDHNKEESTVAKPFYTFCDAPLDPQTCPTLHKLIVYMHDGNLHFSCDDVHVQATFNERNSGLISGTPSFVIQEEFDRFTGIWWAPKLIDGQHVLLYESVDEKSVPQLLITSPGSSVNETDKMRYPRVGCPNAKSTLHMIALESVLDAKGNCVELSYTDLSMAESLKEHFPFYEYLVRAGWLPDASGVWAQVLSRTQTHMVLVHIPLQYFVPTTGSMRDLTCLQSHCTITVLYDEINPVWIYPHNCLSFLPDGVQKESVEFVWASECSGHRHLYLVQSMLADAATAPSTLPNMIQDVPLTSGDWSVVTKAEPVLDTERKLIYFYAFKDTPLESHIYVSSYCTSKDRSIRRLTTAGYSYGCGRTDSSLYVDTRTGIIVTWYSSLSSVPTCQLLSLQFDLDNTSHLPKAVVQYELVMSPTPNPYIDAPMVSTEEVEASEGSAINITDFMETGGECCSTSPIAKLMQYTSSKTGLRHYALLFLPYNWSASYSYPVMLHVYAGPEIQLVQNVWMGFRGFQKYTSLGYAVIMVDGKGTANRGLKFEAYFKHKMGTIEVDDQVEGLQSVIDQSPCPLDIRRVSVFGWSYGGYVSLLCLILRPDIFKVAIAGGPVTSWLLYDTGYTERYMGLPMENVDAYKMGDIVCKAEGFPDQPGRLLLVHGLIDENVHFEHTAKLITALQKAAKPYQLQIFPRERHGVRSSDANNHLDATILLFIQQNL